MPTAEALLAETRWLTRLARDLVGDPHVAEDVVQDTLLAALREQRQRRPIQRLRPWLQAVARNLAFRRRQRDKLRADAEQTSRAGQEEVLPSAAESVERVSVHRSVVDAVLGLAEPYRSTIVLRYLDDLPITEVANRTGVSSETARSRQKRGVAMLRERLDRLYDGDRQDWCLTLLPSIQTHTPTATAVTAGGSNVAKVAGILGAMIMTMTMKAKLAAVTGACGVVVAAMWALGALGDNGPLHDTAPDPGDGKIVAEGEEGEHTLVGSTSKEPAENKEATRQPIANPRLGSLFITTIWADDKKPAAGVMLSCWRKGDASFGKPRKLTDRNGKWVIANLKPGPIAVHFNRGRFGTKHVTIEAGKETHVQIVIPDGVNLDGIVVDHGGNPVPDADLVLAGPHAWDSSSYHSPIATSGADGRFHLRDIGVYPTFGREAVCYVGARARGHAPSPLYAIGGDKGRNLRLRIVLGGSGGGISGRVLDPRGDPVRNAVVRVGKLLQDSRVVLPDGRSAIEPGPIHIRTDNTGHFVGSGLAPGRLPVAVRATGLAPWFGSVEIPGNGNAELLVNLLPAATLSGTVRDDNGRPLARVTVRAMTARSAPARTTWFADRRKVTGADGTYRLEGLGPGKFTIQAVSHQGRTETELVVAAGQTLQWNPVISEGLVLRGRVVDAQGKPIAKVAITAMLPNQEKQMWLGEAQTDKEGRFALKGCVPGKMTRLQVVDSRSNFYRNFYVKPNHENLVLRLPSFGKPSVHFVGQVLGPDGKPLERCRIRASRYWKNITGANGGRFKLGPYPPGRYRVFIEAKGYPVVATWFRVLNNNDTWNLGVIRLQRPGFLLVKLKGDTGLLAKHWGCGIQNSAWEPVPTHIQVVNGRAGRSEPLAPGTYYLQVLDKNYLSSRHKFEIRSGQDTDLEVSLERATPVALQFVVQANGKLIDLYRKLIRVEIKDTTGRRILKASASGFGGTDPMLQTLDFALRPGQYKVTATSVWTGGHRGEATLTVGDKPAAPQRIVLR